MASSSSAKPRSITIDPNPFLRVLSTGGPPVSRHLRRSAEGSEDCTSSQVTRTRPVGFDKAPCLAALAASSWNAMPSETAIFGLSSKSGPSITKRPPSPPSDPYGSSSWWTTSRKEALGRGRRALLVEDNAEVAAVTRAYLEELGFAVHTAGNAGEALRLSTEVAPDLVLSDVVMPGPMNGLELARRLRSRDPNLAIVLATGYSTSAKAAIDDGFSVLSKPYNIASLGGILGAALERAPRARRRGAAPAAS